jgi:hypothetical protein
MIRYALACENGHGFESWFRDSASVDSLAKQGMVSCPQCGAVRVEKQIMAPAVARTDRDRAPLVVTPPEAEAPAAGAAAPAVAGPPAPVALLGERELAFREMVRAVREHVLSTAENVGDRFADEARRMHDGVSAFRSIYGEATPEEAKALAEEGIEAFALPLLPEDRN